MLSAPFNGCCGASVWYLKPDCTPDQLKTRLETMAAECKGVKSVALAILSDVLMHFPHLGKNAIDKDIKEPVLLEFGFKLVWGPICNVNSGRMLYGYFLDLNQYYETCKEKDRLTKLTASNIKAPAPEPVRVMMTERAPLLNPG